MKSAFIFACQQIIPPIAKKFKRAKRSIVEAEVAFREWKRMHEFVCEAQRRGIVDCRLENLFKEFSEGTVVYGYNVCEGLYDVRFRKKGNMVTSFFYQWKARYDLGSNVEVLKRWMLDLKADLSAYGTKDLLSDNFESKTQKDGGHGSIPLLKDADSPLEIDFDCPDEEDDGGGDGGGGGGHGDDDDDGSAGAGAAAADDDDVPMLEDADVEDADEEDASSTSVSRIQMIVPSHLMVTIFCGLVMFWVLPLRVQVLVLTLMLALSLFYLLKKTYNLDTRCLYLVSVNRQVNGNTVFMTGSFKEFKAEEDHVNGTWDEQSARASTADYLVSSIDDPARDNSSFNLDRQLAMALQEQEYEQQPQHNPQKQTVSGGSGLVTGPQSSRSSDKYLPQPQPTKPDT